MSLIKWCIPQQAMASSISFNFRIMHSSIVVLLMAIRFKNLYWAMDIAWVQPFQSVFKHLNSLIVYHYCHNTQHCSRCCSSYNQKNWLSASIWDRSVPSHLGFSLVWTNKHNLEGQSIVQFQQAVALTSSTGLTRWRIGWRWLVLICVNQNKLKNGLNSFGLGHFFWSLFYDPKE